MRENMYSRLASENKPFSNSGRKRTKTFTLITHSGPCGVRGETALKLSISSLAPNFLSSQTICPVPVPFLFLSLISLPLSPYLCLPLPDLWLVCITSPELTCLNIIYLSEPPASTICLACYLPDLSDAQLRVTYAILHPSNLSPVWSVLLPAALPLPTLTAQIFFWSSMCLYYYSNDHHIVLSKFRGSIVLSF